MDLRDIGKIDLNLLVALEVLFEERNVSRAAARLFVTQSAMSKTLGRLRKLFDDQLFTRAAGGMQPTPRAEQIASYLPSILQDLQRIVQPMIFDPMEYRGEFYMALPEYVGTWVLPRLFQRLAERAPSMRIHSAAAKHNHQLAQLASGELDFVVQLERHSYPEEFRVTTLGFAKPKLFARKGHPLENANPSWDDLLQYPKVQLHIPDSEEAHLMAHVSDSDFVRYRKASEAHLTTEHLYTALQVVRSTDFICVGPPLFMELGALNKQLITLKVPIKNEINIKFVVVYHERIADSVPHLFLLQQLMTCVDEWRSEKNMPF